MLLLILLLAACGPADTPETLTEPAEDSGYTAPAVSWEAGDGPLALVSGKVFEFGPAPGGISLDGATISVVEAPEYTTTVDDDGAFSLEVPSGAPLTFRVTQEGFHPVDSAAIFVGEEGLEQVGFQVPAYSLVEPLAIAAGVEMADDRCQLATTVSSEASPPYGGPGVGEPDAVAHISPALGDDGVGPVYFEYISDALILPDPELTVTTIDGGVLWGNVMPGEYVISAEKDGVTFTSPTIRCRAGALVNAAPPYGIEFAGHAQ